MCVKILNKHLPTNQPTNPTFSTFYSYICSIWLFNNHIWSYLFINRSKDSAIHKKTSALFTFHLGQDDTVRVEIWKCGNLTRILPYLIADAHMSPLSTPGNQFLHLLCILSVVGLVLYSRRCQLLQTIQKWPFIIWPGSALGHNTPNKFLLCLHVNQPASTLVCHIF